MNEAHDGTSNLLENQIDAFEKYKVDEVIWRDNI